MIESYTERLVLSNKMFNIGAACIAKLNKMEDSYTRLLRAAKELRQLDNAAEVARKLEVSDQAIQNWKTRGVPNSKLVIIQEKIGVLPQWIATGEGPMEPTVGDGTLDEQQKAILAIMSSLDEVRLAAWLSIGTLLSSKPNKKKGSYIQIKGTTNSRLVKTNNARKRNAQ